MDIERFGSGAPWERRFGYCRAVRAGDLVFVAGTTSVDAHGAVRGAGDPAAQVHHIVDLIEAALQRAGAGLEQVVQTRMYVVDIGQAEEIGRAHGERFGASTPVTAMVQVAALMDPLMVVEIEAVAYVGE